MAAVAGNHASGDPYVDGLLNGFKWGVDNLTFSFPTSGSSYESGYGLGEPRDEFGQLNGTQEAVARAAFALYASVAGLQFSEVAASSGQADLRLAMSDSPSTAWAYYPTTSPEGGDAWFNNSGRAYDSPVKGNYANATFVHEIGHGLGLEHPHIGKQMPMDRDSLEYTIMSYRSYVGASTSSGYTNETWGYPQSLMMYDIAALQRMYGPNYDTNSGNTTYTWSPTSGEMFIDGVGQGAPGGNRIFLTVWDGGGIDTYDFSSYATDLDIDLSPGAWSTTAAQQLAKLDYDGSKVAAGNIANALLFEGDPRALIENARGGSGNDVIVANNADNDLWGFHGDDRLFGRGSNDRLYGQGGNDLQNGQGGSDRLVGHGGDDVLRGGGGSDVVSGGAGEDRVYGDDGDDIVLGGTGRDILFGGLDADRFVFKDILDSPASADRDVIRDFSRAEDDQIVLRHIDADATTEPHDAFVFIGTDVFSGVAGELRYTVNGGGNAVARGDVNGDARDDFKIVVADTTALFADDFLV